MNAKQITNTPVQPMLMDVEIKPTPQTPKRWNIEAVCYGGYIFTSKTLNTKSGKIRAEFAQYPNPSGIVVTIPAWQLNTWSPRDILNVHRPQHTLMLPAPKQGIIDANGYTPYKTWKLFTEYQRTIERNRGKAIALLPAPKQDEKVTRYEEIVHPAHPLFGKPIAIAGFYQYCTVTSVFYLWIDGRYIDTYVKALASIGKHTMTRTIPLSQLIPSEGK